MDSDDEFEYLHPDFNPAKYKVAQLRGLLMKNNVTYPSNVKKQDLIDLFNEHIKPLAAQKLIERQHVVPNHDRIEIVEKKRKLDSTVTVKKKKSSRASTEETLSAATATRRSPRKTSGSKKADAVSVMTNVPDLKVEVQESTAELKSASISRSRSPRRKNASTLKTAKPVVEPKIENISSGSSDDNSGVEIVTGEEFGKSDKSPFKVDPKIESSFSHDNIFQSSLPSSPDFKEKKKKTIPRKRGAEEHAKPSKKTMRPLRKTAFSSSPGHTAPTKSPLKESLAISKFEASSPVSRENPVDELFATGDRPQKETPLKPLLGSTQELNSAPITVEDTPFNEASFFRSNVVGDTFVTPNDGNASRISMGSSPHQTPSRAGPVARKSLVPDLSRFKVSARNLFSQSQSEKLSDTESKELLNDDDREVEEEEEEEEEENADDGKGLDLGDEDREMEDSSLLNLQNEIEDVRATLLKETQEATKQVNDILAEEHADTFHLSGSNVNWTQAFGFFKHLFVFFSFVSVVVFGLWYREQRILIGYCGSEIYQPTFPNTNNELLLKVEGILDGVRPTCLRCPENAICLPSMQIKCKQDYVAHGPWYKLYGILPFSDFCLKDQEKENIINEVVVKSLDLLRTRNADIKCGDAEDFEVGISDDELYRFFYSSKKASISDEEFDEIWEKVLEDLENEPEITVRQVQDTYTDPAQDTNIDLQLQSTGVDTTGSSQDHVSTDEDEKKTNISQSRRKVILRSTSPVKLSMSCKFKKEIYERVQQHKMALAAVIVTVAGLTFVYYSAVKYRQRQSKTSEISDIIVTKLQKQQQNSIRDSTGLTNRYLSAIQLRDELLSTMVNTQKFQLWDSILARLEKNPNIRSSTKEIHGEIVRVLEWIGE